MSFYRIYRPQVIDEIDNTTVRDALLRLRDKPKKDLPHAFLFSGPRGGGKTTSARIVAKLFNCLTPTKNGPCGTCEQCLSIAKGTNLDILEIDAASNRGIDEMRSLRDAVNLSPVKASYRIYIIDEVHMLTAEAFNALLKTLEEPPVHVIFILATTDPQKVPVTIKSRCISVFFPKASEKELISGLKRIVTKEKLDIDDEGLRLITTSVDGSFRDAVKHLEQVSFHKGKISTDVIRSLLSLSEDQVRGKFLSSVRERNLEDALNTLNTIVQDGKDMKQFLVDCLGNLETDLVSLVRGLNKDTLWERKRLQDIIKSLSLAFVELRNSPITRLPVELAVIELCESSDDIPRQSATLPRQANVVIQQPAPAGIGMLTLEHLSNHWQDVIAELKPYNHSVAGVMRSTRPKGVADGIVTIEAFYTFHKDKLSEGKTRDIIASVLKKLFGENVRIEIVVGKK